MNRFKNYKAPSYEEIKKQIEKKVGIKPIIPSDLTKESGQSRL